MRQSLTIQISTMMKSYQELAATGYAFLLSRIHWLQHQHTYLKNVRELNLCRLLLYQIHINNPFIALIMQFHTSLFINTVESQKIFTIDIILYVFN